MFLETEKKPEVKSGFRYSIRPGTALPKVTLKIAVSTCHLGNTSSLRFCMVTWANSQALRALQKQKNTCAKAPKHKSIPSRQMARHTGTQSNSIKVTTDTTEMLNRPRRRQSLVQSMS